MSLVSVSPIVGHDVRLTFDAFLLGLDVVIEDNARLNATSAEYCMPIRVHSVIQSDGVGKRNRWSIDTQPSLS
jgi:hypothetical protein